MQELVPGDLVLLNAGERIPGRWRMLEATKLAVDEAILTGESEPVSKSAASETDTGTSQVFMGTTVVTGRGLMHVTETGAAHRTGPDRHQPGRRQSRRRPCRCACGPLAVP